MSKRAARPETDALWRKERSSPHSSRGEPYDQPGPSRRGTKASHEIHWAKSCFMIVLWGYSLVHILEAMMVGMALKRTSTRRRICYIDEDSVELRSLLRSIWEVREFKHLDTSSMRRSGASQRLSKVYSKIQAWEWLSGEFEAALMLDTDLYIKHSLDEALYKVSHCKIAVVVVVNHHHQQYRQHHRCHRQCHRYLHRVHAC